MRIITISREFGSGGRELGKRLADATGFDYYDREIIAAIAHTDELDEDYVESTLEGQPWTAMPYAFGHTFTISAAMQPPQIELIQAQRKVMDGIVDAGRDCIIVGRNADVFLEDQHPFKIFVCASMEARIQRCMDRAPEGEQLTRKQVEHNIKRIDKNRAKTREIMGQGRWNDCDSYNLSVNTTGWDIKELTPLVAKIALGWFAQQ